MRNEESYLFNRIDLIATVIIFGVSLALIWFGTGQIYKPAAPIVTGLLLFGLCVWSVRKS